jgi:hypothetical protein
VLPQLGEFGRQELDAPVAFVTALTEELSRQSGIGRLEQLVDPVVDLAEQDRSPAAAHTESMLLCGAQTKRKGQGLTDVLRHWALPLRRPRRGR